MPQQATLTFQIFRLIKWWNNKFPIEWIDAIRIFKMTVNSTLAFIFCLLVKVRAHMGTDPAMMPLIAVIVHPGRRVSGNVHAVVYSIAGLLLGLSWSLLGRFLGQKCLEPYWRTMTEAELYENHFVRYQSALGILALFYVITLFFHGWMRSVNTSYFGIVFPYFVVIHFAFMTPITVKHAVIAEAYSTPFYLGLAISLFLCLVVFPEFGSSHLGNSIVDTLNNFHNLIDHSVSFFISEENRLQENRLYSKSPNSLGKLCKLKTVMANKVSNCKLVFNESLYEITYSYVAPDKLKNVIDNVKPLLVYVNGLVDACELKFSLLKKNKKKSNSSTNNISTNYEVNGESLVRESSSESTSAMNLKLDFDYDIRYGDAQILSTILHKVRPSVFGIHCILSECIYHVKLSLAYIYDVNLRKVTPCSMFEDHHFKTYENKKQVREEIDLKYDTHRLQEALIDYSFIIRENLDGLDINFLEPDDEMFLFSSFLVNFRQTAESILRVLRTVDELIEFRKKQDAKGWIRGKRIWFNFLRSYKTLKAWIFTSYSRGTTVTEGDTFRGAIGEDNLIASNNVATQIPFEEENVINNIRGDANDSSATIHNKTGKAESSKDSANNEQPFELTTDNSNLVFNNKEYQQELTIISKCMITCKNFCIRSRNHFRFGFQIVIAMMICSFPMFTPKYRAWYRNYHGPWMGFVCILSMEPSVGDTLSVFILRGIGVFTGSLWAYVSYVTAGGHQRDPYLETVMTCFGVIPGYYVILKTPYVKAALIHTISVYIVMLAAILPSTIPGGILRNFAKRCLAIGYGGAIGLFIQYTIFPLRAREQVSAEISYVCGCIAKMELLYVSSIEGIPESATFSDAKFQKFIKISRSAKSALARATTYKNLAKQEFRIKGGYSSIEKVFTQIIFILDHILDRMNNTALLRCTYGDSIIEEFEDVIHPYRRDAAASVACVMRILQMTIKNKTPLPQNLPSSRIKHRRLVNSVRSILANRYKSELSLMRKNSIRRQSQLQNLKHPHEYYLKEKFLSWNATSSATEEIIAYIEELTYLTKVLVGVNEFKYGFLSRPLYEDWAAEAVQNFDNFVENLRTADSGNASSIEDDRSTAVVASHSIHNVEPVSVESSGSSLQSSVQSPLSDGGSFSLETSLNVREEPQQYLGNDTDIEENLDEPINNNGRNDSSTPKSHRFNLNRISTNKLRLYGTDDEDHNTFRRRVFSIGSFSEDTSLPFAALLRRKTYQSMNDTTGDDNEDSSDSMTDIPLALMKLMTNKNEKHL
ncbi:hypothetical protein TBLA_0A05520 [Henningerozyma blattae CBS 6284]|uniref:Uncharacterized protein n=1 Tax=Henningerozyma blattae (strain ATCC 34711 / CBS 6284 / DSM 70876 / NBRC 10599 / NRRL Y-10934 / UCD 77-7) TaxID=1071380 RepID=I2GW43_HENB6|nr:hypothetical protein TBLA_0A05520 [Tetrapisispora blattae CBS 6284]CCH58345.1 hypothetical protein TBLA_0A05520 [Tetrapisispora blattae CBS 6284]